MNKHKKKGMRGEYEIRDMLQEVVNNVYLLWNNAAVPGFPAIMTPQVQRNLEQAEGRAGRSDIAGLDWLALEVKRHENFTEFQRGIWWEQTKTAASDYVVNDHGERVLGPMIREPVLIWRKNWSAWEVRMFGFLLAEDIPGGLRIRCPVDINLPSFLAYFRARLIADLKQLDLNGAIQRRVPGTLESGKGSRSSNEITREPDTLDQVLKETHRIRKPWES